MDQIVAITRRLVPVPGRDILQGSKLDVMVSRFPNYESPANPKSINLLDWLFSVEYLGELDKIRNTPDKALRREMKAKLPGITPSGLFTYRKEDSLQKHSGLIQFDIDQQDNPSITNFLALKGQIGNIPNVAYCSLSASGNGLWGLVPIECPQKHRQHFDSLQKAFMALGIKIDSKPRNVASLRGYSYDPDPYINPDATSFRLVDRPPVRNAPVRAILTDEQARVETCINEIIRLGIDITNSYEAWFSIGCSLASTFGESGVEYFHQVSQFHPAYSPTRTNKQYTKCLQGKYGYTIASFFNYCYQHGVRYKPI